MFMDMRMNMDHFLEFKSDYNGVTIQYPSNWKVIDTLTTQEIVSPNTNEGIGLLINIENASVNLALDEYAEMLTCPTAAYKDRKKYTDIIIDGNPAVRVVCTVQGMDETVVSDGTFVTHRNYVYTLQMVNVNQQIYSKYLPVLQKMISSFKANLEPIITRDKKIRERLTIETWADLDGKSVYIDEEPPRELGTYHWDDNSYYDLMDSITIRSIIYPYTIIAKKSDLYKFVDGKLHIIKGAKTQELA